MAEQGRTGARDFLASRPVVAEVEAIERATRLAGEAGAKLHIVHISSGRGVVAAAEAKARGVDVSIETCAHYLFFTEEDLERLGAIAKCAPPLRDAAAARRIMEDAARRDHRNRRVGSLARAAGNENRRDYASLGRHRGRAIDFGRACWKRGISAAELPLERIAKLTAATPARRFPDRP